MRNAAIMMIRCTTGTQEPWTSVMCHANPTVACLPFRETALRTSREAANMALLVVAAAVPMTPGRLLRQVLTYQDIVGMIHHLQGAVGDAAAAQALSPGSSLECPLCVKMYLNTYIIIGNTHLNC